MDRRVELLLVLLGVLSALLVAAVTAPLFAADSGGGATIDRGQPTDTDRTDSTDRSETSSRWLRGVLLGLVLLGAIGILAQAATDPWRTLGQIAVVAIVVGAALLVVQRLDSPSPPSQEGQRPARVEELATPTPAGTIGPGSHSGDPALVQTDNLVAFLVGGVIVVLILLTVVRFTPVQSVIRSVVPARRRSSERHRQTMDQTAGTAKNRNPATTSPAAANDPVYRAWLDMTRLLDVSDPRSATPRQFAVAAVEAGLDPDAVDRLTRAFEAVRYGDRRLPPERQAEVRHELRRIEESSDTGSGTETASIPSGATAPMRERAVGSSEPGRDCGASSVGDASERGGR